MCACSAPYAHSHKHSLLLGHKRTQAQALLFNLNQDLFVEWFVDQVTDLKNSQSQKVDFAKSCFDAIKEWVDANL